MKVLIPRTAEADFFVPGATMVRYDVNTPIPAEDTDAEVLVTWFNTPEQLAACARDLPNLRLVQGLAAGPDVNLAAGFAPDVTICSGIGLHDRTVAEHALALLMALVRKLPECAEAQRRHEWSLELGGMQPLHPEGPITTLLGANIVIWGFGSIGTTLAPLLEAMGADVVGVATTAGGRAGFDVVDDVHSVLADCDVLISILPALPSTEKIMDARVFDALPRGAFVINVGRGATVDEDALIAALESGHLGGAGVDVTRVEPLPADSPLWDAPRLLITPHGAGGRPVDADLLVRANVEALMTGEPLRNVARAGSDLAPGNG